MIILSVAHSVTTNSQQQAIWLDIKEPVQLLSVWLQMRHKKHKTRDIKQPITVINYLVVSIVPTDAQEKTSWRNMKEPTLVKILSAAPSVATNAQDYTPWRYIKEHTLVLNCSDFHSVTTNAQHQVIWQSMEELTTVINHLAAFSVINPQHQVA